MDPPADEGGMLDLLGELRDIVEQIDYARAFSAMGGAPFLLGLATHRHRPPAGDAGGGRGRRTVVVIPDALRGGALRTLSTMCQNNPPVQSCLLGCDHVTALARLFLDRTPGIGDDDGRGGGGGDEDGGDDSVRADVVQALSASARGFPPGELALCDGDGGAAVALLLGLGLGMTATATAERREGSPPPPPPPSSARGGGGGGDDGARPTGPARPPSARLRRRSLFLLRALLTSDDATDERHGRFRDVVDHVITRLIDDAWEADAEVREMGLAMATGLLRHEGVGGAGGGGGGGARASSKTMILRHRDHIGSVGVRRIRAIRDLEDGSEEKESATLELEEWENLMVALAEAGNERGGGDAPPLAVCDMHVP
jgi:hsp70-interacting protein